MYNKHDPLEVTVKLYGGLNPAIELAMEYSSEDENITVFKGAVDEVDGEYKATGDVVYTAEDARDLLRWVVETYIVSGDTVAEMYDWIQYDYTVA